MKSRRSRREHRGVELALYGLSFSATLAVGAVHATTQVVLAGAALVLFAVAIFGPLREKGVGIPPLAWVPIAAFAWTALQLLPLPVALMRVLSPHTVAVRDEQGGSFVPMTLDVAATTLELVKLVPALCVLLLGAEILRHGARRVGNAFAVFGVCVMVVLWTHRLFGATRMYGFYVPHSLPGSGLFPPFVNGNNIASVLALCALAVAGASLDRRDMRGPAFGAIAFFCAVSTLGTGSRGGAIGLAAGALFFFTAIGSAKFGRSRAVLLSVLVTATLATGVVLVAKDLRNRFVATNAENTLTKNQKTRGWLAALRLADTYPLTGVGRGAFEAPAAEQRLQSEGIRLVYPENVVLQVVSEWGWPVGVALLGALAVAFAASIRDSRLEPSVLGLAAGVIAVAVHELADFGLEFPGVLLPTTLALATVVASAESENRKSKRPHLREGALVVLLAGSAVVIAGAFASRHTLEVDLARKLDLDDAIRRHPASSELELAAAEQAGAAHDPSVLHHLNRAMRLEPNGWVAHALAAAELERLHHYGQSALEYRLAREHGAELDDAALVRHLGRYAIDVEPKQVEAYLRLGAAYAAYGKYDDATNAYEHATAIAPSAHARAEWLRWMPPERRSVVLEAMEREAQDGDELALVVSGWAAAKNFDRAEHALALATRRYPNSAPLAIAGARMRIDRQDFDGARKAIGHAARFDNEGRLHAEEVLLELAQRTGDADLAALTQARVRLLRAKVKMDEPANGGTP